MNLICTKCGRHVHHTMIKGFMKYPVCKRCFKFYFNNDSEKYNAEFDKYIGSHF